MRFKYLLGISALILFLSAFIIILLPGTSRAWSEIVHTYIAEKAGVKSPEDANIPDLVRDGNYDLYAPRHMHFAAPDARVTPDYIDRFKTQEMRFRLNSGKEITILIPDQTGILYHEIVSLYQRMTGVQGWAYKYYLFNIAHFIADLSQPLHNYPWGNTPAGDGRIYPEIGAWSRDQHRVFDKFLDPYLPPDAETEEMINREIRDISINSTDDLKIEISRIANSALELANKCYAEKRMITKEEAIRQIAMSIALLKSIIVHTREGYEDPVFELPS
jgi:hypothetical protein